MAPADQLVLSAPGKEGLTAAGGLVAWGRPVCTCPGLMPQWAEVAHLCENYSFFWAHPEAWSIGKIDQTKSSSREDLLGEGLPGLTRNVVPDAILAQMHRPPAAPPPPLDLLLLHSQLLHHLLKLLLLSLQHLVKALELLKRIERSKSHGQQREPPL